MYGKKSGAFDMAFFQTYLSEGKHEHTVILYFLGCLFSEIIDKQLKQHLLYHIPSIIEWYDFRYTWFLTCLYHDTATVIEENEYREGCSTDINFYLGKYDVKYKIFEHAWKKSQRKPYTYSEKLIKNYFKYRVEYCHKIDHGIIAGYILYDRLVKNYKKTWMEFSKANSGEKYEHFYYQDLNWRIDHIDHLAIIADAIISHNIWYSENTDESREIYRQYGLDSLFYNPSARITQMNPLVFFLGLLDTVEPFKRFKTRDCLDHVVIQFNNDYKKSIEFKTIDDFEATKWFESVNNMGIWLAVDIENISSNQVIVKI